MVGEIIGSYKITAKLGEGGMGLVYAGEHTLLGKQAAVKVLLPEYSKDAAVIERFFNEAKATTRVRHPGLVDIYDFGYHTDGSAFIVMELLEGESLAARLKRMRRLREPTIVEIARQMAAAIGAAHDVGVIHRDLKPDNVFLVPDAMVSAGFRAKVLDFGIAKLVGAENLRQTRTGAVLGTPMYMSPEQCRGQAIDGRSDIYSLGCMMFEMAAGRPPYVGAGTGDVLAAHIYEPVPPLDPAELSAPLGDLVTRMMAKKPDERPATMRAVVAELEGQLPEPVTGTLAGLGPRPPSAQGMEVRPLIPSPPSQSNLAPRALSTTLGQSAGEMSAGAVSAATTTARGQKMILVGAILGGVVLGVGIVALLRGPGHAHVKPEAPRHEAAAVAAQAAAVAPSAIVPPVPAPVPKAKLRIESVPPGGEVFRADGTRVGIAPVVDEVTRAPVEANYVVKLKGYSDAPVTLRSDGDGATTARLSPVVKRVKHSEEKNGDAIVDPFAN